MLIYLSIIILIVILDFIWLYINADMYKKMVYKIQNSKLIINYFGALLSYICLILVLFLIVFPLVKYEYQKNKNQSLILLSIKCGGLLGLLIYGIINSTNLSIFTNYSYKVAIIDSLWGFIIFSIMTYIYLLFIQTYHQYHN